MDEKPHTELKDFIESVNKKNRKHSGKKVKFSWLRKKGK